MRKQFPDKTLEALYDASGMPSELLSAYRTLDAIVAEEAP